MELELLVVRFLSVLAAVQAAGNQDTVDLQSTPAYLIVGKVNGEIWRCDVYNPIRCEVFHKVFPTSWVLVTLIHGHHLYAGLHHGKLLRCEWYSKSSCEIFQLPATYRHINSLAVTGGYIYVGDTIGIMIRCELNLLQNCVMLHDFSDGVISIFKFDKYIYVATTTLYKCSNEEKFICSDVPMNTGDLWRVTHLGNIFITMSDSDVWHVTSNGSIIDKKKNFSPRHIFDGAVFRRQLYVLLTDHDIVASTDYNTFTNFTKDDKAFSISFSYAVRHMQNKLDADSCLDGRLPTAAFKAEQRWRVEVSVVEGRLVDARGAAVDTRGAGGVFAMGADGQILLISEHRSGLAHIPSLFAGGPVAGGGEMHVEHGVVKRIVACSVHYWPDVGLNRQVVDELYRKGYTGADDIILEECDYKCDNDRADVHSDL